jgi:glycosyltransferase involved in cell wall biosynthesis
MTLPAISIVIPTLNEERWLRSTVLAARDSVLESNVAAEILVSDSGSTDRTRELAHGLGCSVVSSPTMGIGAARNAGAYAASGRALLFLDADTIIPRGCIKAVMEHLGAGDCVGGGFGADYRPKSPLVAVYLRMWSSYASLRHMVQGFSLFCTSEAFRAIDGFDESLAMGEDNDFYWRLRAYAKSRGMKTVVPEDLLVSPSTRRFDQWPLWRVVLMTNPLSVALFRRSFVLWRAWYDGSSSR